MKELLMWVKEQIKGNLTNIKKIKIVPDIYMIPDEKGFPAVGIADNGIKRENIKTQKKEILGVKIALFQSVMKEEGSIIGSGNIMGIEDLMKNVVDLFSDKFPDGYYYNVSIGDESPTQALTNDYERFIVMKTIDIYFYRVL